MSTLDFIGKSKLIHGDKYIYDKVDYIGSKCKVVIGCKSHGEFQQEPRSHLSGKGCYECGGKTKYNNDIFLVKCSELFENTNISYDHLVYSSSLSYLCPICKIHGEFKIRTDRFLSGSSCQFCSKRKMNKLIFIQNSMNLFNKKYDYSLVENLNRNKNIIIICKIHGHFKIKSSFHLMGKGCSCCEKESLLLNRKFKFIKNSLLIHGDKYLYDKINYINSYTNINIICKDHGSFNQIPNNHLNGSGCPKCTVSKGENLIINYLNKKSINYNFQFKFKNCRNLNHLIFDFYLPDYNTCIEYNGRQHYEPVEYFGGVKSLEKQKINDNIKKEYCRNNNLNLLIIKYNEDVEDLLNSILNI